MDMIRTDLKLPVEVREGDFFLLVCKSVNRGKVAELPNVPAGWTEHSHETQDDGIHWTTTASFFKWATENEQDVVVESSADLFQAELGVARSE